MSTIVGFRDTLMQYLRDQVPELQQVDWYEGMFSVEDVQEWSMNVPGAWVSITGIPRSSHHMTGEINIDLRCVVAVVDCDRASARDADARVWGLLEKIAILANLNTFGDPNAGPATGTKFLRLSDMRLRDDLIALGVVEWQTTLTVGVNKSREREEIWFDGEQVTRMPTSLSGRAHLFLGTGQSDDSMVLDGDGYQGDSTLDRGVAEMPMVPAQKWEPEP